MTEKLTVNLDMDINEKFENEKELTVLIEKITGLEVIEIEEMETDNGFANVTVKGTLEQFVKCGYDADEIEDLAE